MNLKVLLVDDEQPILDNLTEFISWETIGIEVAGTARTGREALEQIAEFDPDLILCDIRMPIMDGLSFIKQYRERDGKLKFCCLPGIRSLNMQGLPFSRE